MNGIITLFGLIHRGYNNVVNGTADNLKQYQGQEFTDDLGLNIHEWKYRWSDPAIGRFWQVHPLAQDYYHNGVYNFSVTSFMANLNIFTTAAVT